MVKIFNFKKKYLKYKLKLEKLNATILKGGMLERVGANNIDTVDWQLALNTPLPEKQAKYFSEINVNDDLIVYDIFQNWKSYEMIYFGKRRCMVTGILNTYYDDNEDLILFFEEATRPIHQNDNIINSEFTWNNGSVISFYIPFSTKNLDDIAYFISPDINEYDDHEFIINKILNNTQYNFKATEYLDSQYIKKNDKWIPFIKTQWDGPQIILNYVNKYVFYIPDIKEYILVDDFNDLRYNYNIYNIDGGKEYSLTLSLINDKIPKDFIEKINSNLTINKDFYYFNPYLSDDTKVYLLPIDSITPGRSENSLKKVRSDQIDIKNISKVLLPIKINRNNIIEDGNHRYYYSKKNNYKFIPAIYIN